MAADLRTAEDIPGTVVVRETGHGLFQQEIISGRHHLIADEPKDVGGLGSGPGPYDLLLAALGACTSMTLRLYAERKGLRLDRIAVRLRHAKVHAADCDACEPVFPYGQGEPALVPDVEGHDGLSGRNRFAQFGYQ